MIKYLTHKLRTQSINDDNNTNEKIDGHDSGTESDGDIEPEDDINEIDRELNNKMIARNNEMTPVDPIPYSDSPAFLEFQSHSLMYDQHSSEEELEVINGSLTSKYAFSSSNHKTNKNYKNNHNTNASVTSNANFIKYQNPNDRNNNDNSNDFNRKLLTVDRNNINLINSNIYNVNISPRRSNSLLENRKRSLAHSTDDEVRHLLELHPQQLLSVPVNFRTSPPMEALKPHRNHMIQCSTTPSIANDIAHNSEALTTKTHNALSGPKNSYMMSSTTATTPTVITTSAISPTSLGTTLSSSSSSSSSPSVSSTTSISSLSSIAHHQQSSPYQQYSLGEGVLSSNLILMTDARSCSPPAKVFHCGAVSPRRRQSRHQNQRLQRSHRPCLDFDKMQQLKTKSVTSWRPSNEHTGGEVSIFCW